MTKLIPLASCRPGGGVMVAIRDRELAVFRLADPDRVCVTDNACPHAGGNLSAGAVNASRVTCPWHHWVFDLPSGVCVDSERVRVRCYPAEVRGGDIWVDLDVTRPGDPGTAGSK